MVFSSVIFVFAFLPLVILLNFILPRPWRNPMLLLASLLFYAWGETVYVLVMLSSITMNHLFGLAVERTRGRPAGRWMIHAAVIANLLLLIAFKYANFLCDNLNVVLQWMHVPPLIIPPVHLPLGISFFTFQAMSYVIDVHRQQVPAEPRLDRTALFITLFPQLIAGPIVRYRDIAAEIAKRRETLADFASGVRLFIIGLGKKMLIANVLAEPCDRIFAIPDHQLTTPLAWAGAVLYALQIYFDFSGYSDMAIGMGRMFGFHFNPNFRYPYISKTITEMWQRWHISLSTWFRDYLFSPLGGYRCSRERAYINLLIVFFLCGLWHGASWNFIVFGLYQGTFLIIERIIRANRLSFFKSPFSHVYCLFVIISTMVWFRAADIGQAAVFYAAMCGFGAPDDGHFPLGMFLNNEVKVCFVAGLIGCAPFAPWLGRVLRGPAPSPARATLVQALTLLALAAIFVLCSMKLAAGTHNPFIYFRF